MPFPSTLRTQTHREQLIGSEAKEAGGRRKEEGAGSYLSWSTCWSASYMQKGLSMVVHSLMKAMEPPVSAEMSQIASSL